MEVLENGLHPIYGRIRMDGITVAFVTCKAVRPEDWDVEMNQVKKSHPEHAIINAHLEEFLKRARVRVGVQIKEDTYRRYGHAKDQDNKALDLPYGKAYLRYHHHPQQRSPHRDSQQNAGT